MRAVPVLAMTVATGLASVANAQQQPTPAQPPAQAQQQAPRIPRAAASTRASVQVLIDSRFDAREGGWFGALNLAGPARIVIDYGQPHLRAATSSACPASFLGTPFGGPEQTWRPSYRPRST